MAPPPPPAEGGETDPPRLLLLLPLQLPEGRLLGGKVGPHSRGGLGGEVEREEGQQGTQVKSEDWRDDAPEQVQVRIGNGEDGLEGTNALGLGEPRQEDAGRNDRIVGLNEVAESPHEDLLGYSVSWDGHGEGQIHGGGGGGGGPGGEGGEAVPAALGQAGPAPQGAHVEGRGGGGRRGRGREDDRREGGRGQQEEEEEGAGHVQ